MSGGFDAASRHNDDVPFSGDAMAVNRCICFDRAFSELRAIAERTEGGLLEVHRETGCGARCGLCLPYILQTGETDLPVLWSEDFRREGINPGRLGKLETRIADEEAEGERRA